MNTEQNIKKFEALLGKVNRDGVDKVLKYVKEQSDFYRAPSSTMYHLSVAGGLLQHSLNVYEALKSMLQANEDGTYSYVISGHEAARISEDTLILITLLHDICKTSYYETSKRNQKIDGRWCEVDYFTIANKIPYGHGEKSVMMIDSMVRLSMEEKMAIRWHMGMPSDNMEAKDFSLAVEMFPIIWALHSADMMCAHFIESNQDNNFTTETE